jgi:antibiotic biosynthesis monooxygenase (ABM) superfamily enzyme
MALPNVQWATVVVTILLLLFVIPWVQGMISKGA